MYSNIENYYLELFLRFNKTIGSLNFSLNEWLCNNVLASYDRPISESSLALIVGLPRTTVRSYVEDSISKGFVRRVSKLGVEITPFGQLAMKEITNQSLQIATGYQSGFKDVTISTMQYASKKSIKSKNRDKDLITAREISFQPKLDYPV
jgi:hypothetical protein